MMPIYRLREKLILFSHIPKTGGTSVDAMLASFGCKVGFLDPDFYDQQMRWSATSPQHIDGHSFKRLFASDFFDAKFTVVRHPVSRFLSAYRYHIRIGNISPSRPVSDFVQNTLLNRYNELGFADNHFLPQYRFLSSGEYVVFKIENGLVDFSKWLCKFFELSSPPVIAKENVNSCVQIDDYLDEETILVLRDLYKPDFEYFKYGY